MNRSALPKISKALGDETRFHIYEAIAAKGEVACAELVSMCSITPATVSHHLKILQEAGLIDSRSKGLFVYSRIKPRIVEEYAKSLQKLAKPRLRRRVRRTE